MRSIFIIHCICTMYNVSRAAFDRISGDISQKVDTLASEPRNLPDTAVASHGNTPVPSPGSLSTTQKISIAYLLANAKTLPPMKRSDLGDLKHWEPAHYRLLRGGGIPKTENVAEDTDELLAPEVGSSSSSSGTKRKTKNESPILSCFLEDRDGNPISKTEKKAIFGIATAYWQYLVDTKRAPKSFRSINIEIKHQWYTLMESSFECLRYCSGRWKLDQLWINYYTHWLPGALDRKAKEEAEARARALKAKAKGVADDTVIDVDDDCSEDVNNEGDGVDVEEVSINENHKRGHPNSGKTSKSKRARVEPRESTPPAPPTPVKVTTRRARVRTLFSLAI